jgi:hypothetical protein
MVHTESQRSTALKNTNMRKKSGSTLGGCCVRRGVSEGGQGYKEPLVAARCHAQPQTTYPVTLRMTGTGTGHLLYPGPQSLCSLPRDGESVLSYRLCFALLTSAVPRLTGLSWYRQMIQVSLLLGPRLRTEWLVLVQTLAIFGKPRVLRQQDYLSIILVQVYASHLRTRQWDTLAVESNSIIVK